VAAPQEPGEKQLPAPYCSSDRGTAFTGRVVGNHLLVLLKFVLRNVALVLILEQNTPFSQWAPQATPDVLAAILDADLAHRAPKSIGARMAWTGLVRML
jgi:hypothetical protein